MGIVYIYKIKNHLNKIYIGSTSNYIKRWNDYKILNCKQQPKIYKSLLKYGHETHTFEIIEECNSENRNEREYYWGNYYEVLTREKGLNCRLPKIDDYNYCTTVETREKIKESLTGNLNPMFGKKHSNESKEKMRLPKLGKKISEETREKMRNSQKGVSKNLGRKHSQETKDKMSIQRARGNSPNAKKIIHIESGKIWDCLRDCSDELKINFNTLKSNLNKNKVNNTKVIYYKQI